MTPIHIQWADDGQHIRKWARDPFAGSTEYAAIATPIADDAVVTISGKTLHDYVDRAYVRQRIGELMEEGDGFWRACCGCQESTDGYVSATDYPYNETFRCHPGSGCSECGGIGVLWDDGRGYGDITGDEEPASADRAEALSADEMEDHPKGAPWHARQPIEDLAKKWRGRPWVPLEAAIAALQFWQRRDYAHSVAALARPRAAVGERDTILEQAAQEAYRVCAETRHVTLGDKARAAILALQSPPAKVEGSK